MVKWVLGKGEIEILKILKNPKTPEDIEAELRKKLVWNGNAAFKKTLNSLNDKKLTQNTEIHVALTKAGNIQRDVLVLVGVITEEAGGHKNEKSK